MTPEGKGKFCDSCQKTVIDFSNMSDNQLAQFFKKPASSVCGRFHQDQLEREINIPRKRIPWVKYFFQITWPAFMLFLKSCGQREQTMGVPLIDNTIDKKQFKEMPIATLGYIMPQITAVDTMKKNATSQPIEIVGKITLSEESIKGDTIAVQHPITVIDSVINESKTPMDTVVISQTNQYLTGRITGGLVISKCTVTKEEISQIIDHHEEFNVFAYPNPIKAGGQLTLSFSGLDHLPEQIQILSTSGAVVANIQQSASKFSKLTKLTLPSAIPGGIYFIQIISKTGKNKTVKIVVTN
jgi:hypothetical protein